MAADRSLLSFRSGVDTDVQSDAESKTIKVTRHSDYRGACPSTKKTLNAIYSYSYREDSVTASFILCRCAEPRKSPTIGQLQEIVTIRCGNW